MNKEKLAQFVIKTTPLVMLGAAACFPTPEKDRCPVDVNLQASFYRGTSKILFYEGEDASKIDLSRVSRAASRRDFTASFNGSDREFPMTTDNEGKANLEVDLTKEGIRTRNPYLLIQTEGGGPANERVSCGDKVTFKVLIPEAEAPAATHPKPTSTHTPPTYRPTATPTPEPTSTPRYRSTPTPEAIPTPRYRSTPTPEPTDTPEPRATSTPTPIPTTTPTVTSRTREYPQCGCTYTTQDGREITFEKNKTVIVTENTDNKGNKSYSCSVVGVIPGQCDNPK